MSAAAGLIDQVQTLYAEHDDLRAITGATSIEGHIAYVDELKSALATLIASERRRLNEEARILSSIERF